MLQLLETFRALCWCWSVGGVGWRRVGAHSHPDPGITSWLVRREDAGGALAVSPLALKPPFGRDAAEMFFIFLMDRTLALFCSVFVLILGLCVASPHHRLVCWKAILQCHGEPECHYAYDQYLYACTSVINGAHKKCPSHCISSLIQLNLTRSGPALEDCDCAMDPVCRSTKRAIEPCLPRTSTGTMGCTEARRQCEMDQACSSAMRDYLFHCRKLFGGERCSDGCRKVISNMRSIPKAQQLDTCVCDGTERNICEYIKVSMKTFCSEEVDAGSGFSDSEEDSDDDYIDSEDCQYVESRSSGSRACRTLLSLTSTVVLLSRLIWAASRFCGLTSILTFYSTLEAPPEDVLLQCRTNHSFQVVRDCSLLMHYRVGAALVLSRLIWEKSTKKLWISSPQTNILNST